MIRITDKSFRYVPAVKTNLKATFDRIRRQQADASKKAAADEAAALANVKQIGKRGAK